MDNGHGEAVHVVLAGGGVRCWAYFGAVDALLKKGFRILSITGVSAGSAVGAVIASRDLAAGGESLQDTIRWASNVNLRKVRGPARLLPYSFLFYPFAKYKRPGAADLVDSLLGGDATLGDLKTDFATTAADLLTGRVLVYSRRANPEMRISEVLRVSLAAPGLYPMVHRGDRLLADGVLLGNVPAWIPAAEKDGRRILVLSAMMNRVAREPRDFGSFMARVTLTAIHGADDLILRLVPNVVIVPIHAGDVRVDDFTLSPIELSALIDAGSMSVEQSSLRCEARCTPAPVAPPPQKISGLVGHERAMEGGRLTVQQFFEGAVNMGDNYHVSATNSVVGIRSDLNHVANSVAALPIAEEERTELLAAIARLSNIILELRSDHAAKAALLSQRLKEVVDQAAVSPENRDKSVFDLTVGGLKDAAEAVGDIVPGLVATATSIARLIGCGV